MATIEKRLSSKIDENGKCQILIRFFHGKVNQREKSGIYILPKHFRYFVNRDAARKEGVKIPEKVTSVTKDEAVKLGYPIKDSGEVVIKERGIVTEDGIRIDAPEVVKEKENASSLDKLQTAVVDAFNELKGGDIPADFLKTVIYKFHNPGKDVPGNNEDPKKTIYQLADEYLERKRFSDGVFRGFKVLLRDMARYEAFCRKTGRNRKRFEWNVHRVTLRDIEDFESYLRNERALAEENPEVFEELLKDYPLEISAKHKSPKLVDRGDNTLHKLLSAMKTFWKQWILDRGISSNNPFASYKMPTERYGTEPYYLTLEERNKLADFDFGDNKDLEIQRDIFVFHCLTGCRVRDLLRLTSANITDNILTYTPSKTRKSTKQPKNPRVPLTSRAQELIKKFEGVDAAGRLFPFKPAQKYNDAIKKVLEVAGIDRNVSIVNGLTGEIEIHPIYELASSHMARRTFCGLLYRQVKDPNLIGRMSGHVEGSRAFARYRRIDDDDLREAIYKME